MRKPTAKQLDKQIEQIFYRTSSGVQIDIMDISKIFAAGREAHAAGSDMEAAIVSRVSELRKN